MKTKTPQLFPTTLPMEQWVVNADVCIELLKAHMTESTTIYMCIIEKEMLDNGELACNELFYGNIEHHNKLMLDKAIEVLSKNPDLQAEFMADLMRGYEGDPNEPFKKIK